MTAGSTPPDLSSSTLGAEVRSSVHRIFRRFRSERPEGSLGIAALEVLSRLEKHGPQSLSDLSRYDHVAPASMSQTVNRLTSAGYAVRTADEADRRRVLFSATEEGAVISRAARAQRNSWLEGHLDMLDDDDRAAVARVCAIFDSMADA